MNAFGSSGASEADFAQAGEQAGGEDPYAGGYADQYAADAAAAGEAEQGYEYDQAGYDQQGYDEQGYGQEGYGDDYQSYGVDGDAATFDEPEAAEPEGRKPDPYEVVPDFSGGVAKTAGDLQSDERKPADLDKVAEELERELRGEDEKEPKTRSLGSLIAVGLLIFLVIGLGGVAVAMRGQLAALISSNKPGPPPEGSGGPPDPTRGGGHGLDPRDLDPDKTEIEDPGSIGQDEKIEQLADFITGKDQTQWDAAVVGLATYGEDAVPTVQKLLEHPSPNARRLAAQAAEKIGPKAKHTIPVLVKNLGDSSRMVRQASQDALFAMGEASIPSLMQGLNHKDEEVRGWSARTLAKFGPQAEPATDKLIDLLNDDNRQVRGYSANALSKIGKPAVPKLVAAATHENEYVRLYSVFALGEIQESTADVQKALGEALLDSRSTIRNASRQALIKLGVASVPTFIGLLKTDDENVQKLAGESLAKIGAEAVPQLIEGLGNKDSVPVRYWSAYALGEIGPEAEAAVPKLKASLKDPDATVRFYVAEALRKINR